MGPQHEQHNNSTGPHHETREYEYPNSETGLGPAPAHHLPSEAHHHESHAGTWIAVVVICLLLASIAAYFFYLKPKLDTPKATTTPAKNSAAAKSPSTAKATPESTSASALKSTKLNLEITKPSGWKGQADPASGELTLTSPETTYTSYGASKTGVFVLTVRQGVDSAGQKAIHDTNAIQDSETIAYSAPTANQYQYTNVTIAGTLDAPSYLIVTSSEQFKKGEAMARFFINGDTYVIVGGFRAAEKTGFMGYDGLPQASFIGSPQYKEAVTAIKSLKIF